MRRSPRCRSRARSVRPDRRCRRLRLRRRRLRRSDVGRARLHCTSTMSEKILRRLKVLTDTAEKEALPTRKFFHIGNAEVIEPYGEMLPLLSWVDDNLSRYVLSTAPSTSWGRIRPAPLVFSLP